MSLPNLLYQLVLRLTLQSVFAPALKFHLFVSCPCIEIYSKANNLALEWGCASQLGQQQNITLRSISLVL